jgi:hypothetical protein
MLTDNFQKSLMVGGRTDLARLANRKGLKRAVEVGTDRGIFARDFLQLWNGEMLYCVDTWQSYVEMPWDRSGDYDFAVGLLLPFANRVRIVKSESLEVAKYFGKVDGFPVDIDFVYIDAAHDFVSATQDIKAWWPIVREGGILAGDDFDDEHSGVKEAVIQFANLFDLRVYLTTDYDRGPSWYIEK